MKLRKDIGKLEAGLGITLTQDSTEAQIKSALKHAPHLSKFIEGATKDKQDGKTSK